MEIKFNKKDLGTLKPLGLNLTLKYETDYLGDEKEQTIKVYPLKVEEKIIIQQLFDEMTELNKHKDNLTNEEKARLIKINDEINLKYVMFCFNKIMSQEEQIDEDFVREHIPNSWYKMIINKTLEAEGYTKKDISDEKN